MIAKMARYLKLSRYKKIEYQEMRLLYHHVEFYMKRKRASKLIKKYIHLKPEMTEEIAAFKKKFFIDSWFLNSDLPYVELNDRYPEAKVFC